jgi:hypothetical protein
MPIEILDWLYSQGSTLTADNCHKAAGHGNFDALKWYRARGARWIPRKVMSHAALSGNLEMFKWLRESEGLEWNKKTSKAAAKGKNLELLKYVLENGCPYNEKEITEWSAGQNPEMLKWVIGEKKFKWDTDTLACAISKGNINTIAWAIRNGCPVDRKLVMFQLVHSSDIEIVRFLTDELKLEFSASEVSEIVQSSYDNLQILTFLWNRGYRWKDDLKEIRENPDPRIRQLAFRVEEK